MNAFITALVAAILTTTTAENNATQPILIKGCTQNGQQYAIGETFQPNPCEHCHCSASGQPLCAITDCFITPCVDPINDPTKCCQQCPDGPNCKAPDGHIIKQHETYQMDENTICTCTRDHLFFGPNLPALCATKDPSFTGSPIQLTNGSGSITHMFPKCIASVIVIFHIMKIIMM